MVPKAAFGSTGHQSSRVIFGAAALSRVSQERADQMLPLLLANGVNHLDTAAGYGDSELRLAPWLLDHRDDFFLATKTAARDGVGARAGLEASLERLGVDRLDLIQLHNLVEDDEIEEAFSSSGAVDALAKARDEGLVRFIGITGHGTRIPSRHFANLDRFAFDSVLFPFNYPMMQNATYARDVEALLERCADRGVAVQTIKSIARRRWIELPERDDRRSWYQPLEDQGAIERAVHHVLANPQLFLNSSSDYELLPIVLQTASEHIVRPNDSELEADAESFAMQPLFDGAALERI